MLSEKSQEQNIVSDLTSSILTLFQGLLNIKNELIDHIVKWLPLEKCSNQVFQEFVTLIIVPWIRTYHWDQARRLKRSSGKPSKFRISGPF